jgi:hypothetical protein
MNKQRPKNDDISMDDSSGVFEHTPTYIYTYTILAKHIIHPFSNIDFLDI